MPTLKTMTSALAMTALLSACTPELSAQNTKVANTTVGQTNAYVDDALAKAAGRSADALETLAMTERAKSPKPVQPVDETDLPSALQRKITLDWSGPASEALRKVASSIGYQFMETGKSPQVPVLTRIGAVDVPAAKLLERIGTEVYPFATVTVDPNVSRIELRYLSESGITGLSKASVPTNSGAPISLSPNR